MTCLLVLAIAFAIFVWVYLSAIDSETPDFSAMSQKKRKQYAAEYQHGPLSPVMICPHCQSKGTVRTKKFQQKKGISGAKATGAVLTGGLSILATGLSRKEDCTQAHCDNCDCDWKF